MLKGIVRRSMMTGKVLNLVGKPLICKYIGRRERPKTANDAPCWAVPMVVESGFRSAKVNPRAIKNSFDITLPNRLPESTRALQAMSLMVIER